MLKIILSGLLATVFLAGCDKPGPAQEAGERLDDVGDNIEEGKNPLHKRGAIEKAGKAVDDAVGGK